MPPGRDPLVLIGAGVATLLCVVVFGVATADWIDSCEQGVYFRYKLRVVTALGADEVASLAFVRDLDRFKKDFIGLGVR